MGKVIMSGIVPQLVAPSTLPTVGTALADCTPEDIQTIIRAGQASNYWSVGDTVPIALNGTVGALTFNNETYYAFIIGFDHNSAVEGSNTIHFQFGKTGAGKDIAFVDSAITQSGSAAAFRMNLSQTNSGGWKSSYMRSTICPAFKSAMPTAWQNVIAACTKYSDNTGGGSNTASNVTATSDEIFCLAEFEVNGARTYANGTEQNYQKQYDYYKAGNSKVKYRHSGMTTDTCMWWVRSAHYTRKQYFCCVGTTASSAMNSSEAFYSLGFAPGFMVA